MAQLPEGQFRHPAGLLILRTTHDGRGAILRFIPAGHSGRAAAYDWFFVPSKDGAVKFDGTGTEFLDEAEA